MNLYEKENAKEWQLDLTNNPTTQPSQDESDSDSDNGNAGRTAGLSRNRFAPISSGPLNERTHTRPATQSPKGHAQPATPRFGRGAARTPTREQSKAQGQSNSNLQRLPANQLRDTPRLQSKISAKPAVPAKTGPPPRITFSSKKDNDSKAAFRKGKIHNSTFTLSKTCEKIEPDRSRMYARLEEIGVRFGSFIRPPQRLNDRTLLLWGNEKQVAETIGELQHWVSLSEKDSLGVRETMITKAAQEKYPKVGELRSKKDEILDKKIKQAADMHVFQKDPIEGQHFEFQGYFIWPSDEVKPEDLLGPSCEAFDPIRTYNHSHIVWDPQISCFKILSNAEAAMQNAIERIEGTMKEWAARSSTTYAFNVVQPPEALRMCENVKTQFGPPLAGSAKPSIIPILTGRGSVKDPVKAYNSEKEDLEAANKRKIQGSLCKIIERLQYFRGRLRMRALFGTFVLDTIRWPGGAQSIPLTEFVTSITNTATTTGIMLRDLQCQGNIQALIHRLLSSEGSFQPIDMTREGEKEVVPIYTARFRFRSRETGDVTLEVELHKPVDGSAIYEVSREQWARNDQTEMSSPLDVNVVQLTGGCSWRLHISHNTTIDDTLVTPRMADFASSVEYKAPPSEVQPGFTGCKVFKHAYNMQYESFEQKTAFRFRHKEHGAWILEVARYDTFSPNVTTASSKTQWGASFWNTEWDTILSANDNLGIGQAAKWEPNFDRFFPVSKDGKELGKDGFQSFLDDVKDITRILDEMMILPAPE